MIYLHERFYTRIHRNGHTAREWRSSNSAVERWKVAMKLRQRTQPKCLGCSYAWMLWFSCQCFDLNCFVYKRLKNEFSWFSVPLHNQTLVAPCVTTILLKKHITDVTRFNINTLAQKSLSHSLFLSHQLPFFLLHTSTLLSFQTDWTSSLKAESSRTTSLLFPLHHS